jgi:hypothetical protein
MHLLSKDVFSHEPANFFADHNAGKEYSGSCSMMNWRSMLNEYYSPESVITITIRQQKTG